jgi:ferritin
MPAPLNEKVAEAMNRQINNELRASHVYFAMSAYFEAQELPGFAGWFRHHSVEEKEHAKRLYSHIVKRDARVKLGGIDEPRMDWKNVEEVVAAALAMEQEVTGQIHDLFELVHESKEYGSQPILHWFLEEQVEEEDTFRRLLDRVKASGDSRWHLLMLDGELSNPEA